jgi:hypothetical protein
MPKSAVKIESNRDHSPPTFGSVKSGEEPLFSQKMLLALSENKDIFL